MFLTLFSSNITLCSSNNLTVFSSAETLGRRSAVLFQISASRLSSAENNGNKEIRKSSMLPVGGGKRDHFRANFDEVFYVKTISYGQSGEMKTSRGANENL